MSGKFSDIQKRFSLVRRPYKETADVTVTQLVLSLASQSGVEAKLVEEEVLWVEGTEEPQTPRNEFGNVFHRVMELLVRTRSKSIKASWIQNLAADLTLAERKEIQQSALKFWRGPWGRRIQSARRCYPELPFIYKTRYGILKGQIDLVFQSKEGDWFILDYKTNRIEKNQIQEASKEYEKQLAFYALVFKRLYGEFPKKGVLYFSAAEGAREFEYHEKDFAIFEVELEAAYRTVLK